MPGKLYLCATPIGNLGDISKRFIETIESVDIIAAEDTRHTKKLLNHLNISKPMISYFEHNRREKGEKLIKELLFGKSIALVSDAGTPAISDPGEDLVVLCAENGIEVVPVPGPVAAVCALIVSAIPTGRFCFEGFLPMNRKGREERLLEIKDQKQTLIFYEAPHKLKNTLADLLKFLGDRRIAVCREITKLHEETFRTTVSGAIKFYEENLPRGEYVLVVEGAGEEKAENPPCIDIHKQFELLTKSGMSEMDAMKEIAKMLGVSKREIYAEIKTKKGEDKNE